MIPIVSAPIAFLAGRERGSRRTNTHTNLVRRLHSASPWIGGMEGEEAYLSMADGVTGIVPVLGPKGWEKVRFESARPAYSVRGVEWGVHASCWTGYLRRKLAQRLQRQQIAANGRYLPNPYGSRLCAVKSLGRMHPRNCISSSAVAIAHVAHGHLAIASRWPRRLPSCCALSTATQSWPTSWMAHQPHGGRSYSAPGASQRRKTQSTEARRPS